MEWLIVISFVLLGIALMVAEIILIPGTTVVGIIGFCMTVGGIIMSFNYFGKSTGWIVLGSSAVAAGVMLYFSFRTRSWEWFSLKSQIDSRVNEGAHDGLSEGQEGVTVSSLRPSGKADIGGKLYEVNTLGNFVESGTKVKVIRIGGNRIVVEPILNQK